MVDVEILTSRIKRNCNISDAKYWGSYSICGLLLRLRELYRVERGIRPWEKIQQKEIAEWISERENLWQELEDKDFGNIIVGGNVYSPFEAGKINEVLEEEGLIYGAGYGLHMKPSFFLADVVSKKTVDGYEIYIAGSEYVRDLSDYPAMLQDKAIFARVDTTRLLLWGKFEELRLRGSKGALAFAFSRYGITPEEEPSEDINRRLSLIACSEVETYIRHELGEAFEGEKLGDEWKVILAKLSSCRAELFVRGVKDLLSDTSEKGMIRYIIENRKEGALGFYIVFLGGYRRLLFPEILKAFERFTETGDWGLIDDARKAGYKKAKGYAERLLLLHDRSKIEKTEISGYIENEILSEL
ncbi:MAG: Sfum_1244 family protein [Nitrospirota bacterium]